MGQGRSRRDPDGDCRVDPVGQLESWGKVGFVHGKRETTRPDSPRSNWTSTKSPGCLVESPDTIVKISKLLIRFLSARSMPVLAKI